MRTLFRLLFGKRRSADIRNPLLLCYLDDFNAPKHTRFAEVTRF